MVPLTPRRRPSPLARLGLAAFWIVLAVGPAGAATFTVTKTADTDDGVCDATDCSLREAITAANNDVATSNVIDFASSLPASSTITLLTPLPLNISQQLLIDGTTATNLTVRGDATRSLFDVAADTTIADVILQNGQLAIFDDIRLKFDVGEDQTLSEVIADADAPPLTGGQVEKLGAATLILLGANTYSGGTTVTAGTLQGNADSLQGTITLAADTLLVFDQGVDDAFTGTVTGAGRVEKIGALQTGCVEAVDGAKCFGILTVNGPLTHTGGTTVTTGVLRIDPDDMPGDVSVGASGALALDLATNDRVFAHVVSGAGVLAKDGRFTLTLTGANIHEGGTGIGEGILKADTNSLQGDVAIGDTRINPAPNPLNPPTLTLDQDFDGTFTGDISGTGLFTKEGTGTLTLVGVNTYDGPTTVTAGTLQGDTSSLQGDINVIAGAALVFDQATDGTFDGNIGDDGTVEKAGAGRPTLNRDQFYTGLTTVSGGRLDLASAAAPFPILINSNVQVDAGATFGGNGTVNNTLTVDGTVSPGNAIGTLTVGNVVFNDGSVLEAEVNDSGGGDLLMVNGDADIQPGVSVRALPEPGDYSGMGVTVPILTATGVCNGSFDSASTNSLFLDALLSDCSTGTVSLTVQENDATFSDFAQTPNQTAVAAGLDAAKPTATGDLDLVFQNLTAQLPPLREEEEVQRRLDAIGGEPLTGFPTTRLAVATRFNRSVHERVRGFAWRNSEALFAWGGDAGANLHAASPQRGARTQPRVSPSALRSTLALGGLAAAVSLAPDDQEFGPGAWIDGYGLFGDLEGDANASDVDYSIAGTSLGFDQRLANHVVVGGAAGYARTVDLDFKQRNGSGDANTFQGALYAGRVTPLTYLSASARFAYSDMNTSRRIVFADIDRTAEADFNGWDAGAAIEAGVNLVELWGVSVQPLASFDYVHVQTEGYTEKGADSLNLTVESESLDSVVSGVGLRFHGTIQMDRETWWTPEVRVRWAHEFGDRDREIQGVLPAAATGGSWLVRGADSPADGFVVGASWTVTTAGKLHVFADYDAVLNRDLVEHSVALGVRMEW